MENRHGLIVDAKLTHANGRAEREAALDMLGDLPAGAPITVGADKAYDTRDFVADARRLGVTPHVAQNTKRPGGSAIDGRTTRHADYRASQVIRKRIEEANGWLKEVAGMAHTTHRGLPRVGWMFALNAAAYNLIRMPKLMPTGGVCSKQALKAGKAGPTDPKHAENSPSIRKSTASQEKT